MEPRGFYAGAGRRILDFVLLAILAPLVFVPCLTIALTNWIAFRKFGEIFYTQDRVGFHGRVFRIYKFRTMRGAPEGDMTSWSTGMDQERVTPFGQFLRSTHLDELPQLLNIIRGEMSFIGPRPEMVEIEAWARDHVPGFASRLVIRPGITGFAQITQGYTPRSREAYQRKLDLCLSYITTMSLTTDIWIIWLTVVWMLRGKGWQWRAEENELTRTAYRLISEHSNSIAADVDDVVAPIPERAAAVAAPSADKVA